jgi:hypothetical protein
VHLSGAIGSVDISTGGKIIMKRCLGLMVAAMFVVAAPVVMAQAASSHSDHIEIGVFGDYFRFSASDPVRNYVGLGGRAAFALNRNVQLEAEMAYDFKRNYTYVCDCGTGSSITVNSHLRTLHGLFGPKFQTGSGPFRIFVTGKAGFDNFSYSDQSPANGFTGAVTLNSGTTDFAVYPGAGVEAFAGPIGLRLEAGDQVYFDHGAHNNLRATVGVQLRF